VVMSAGFGGFNSIFYMITVICELTREQLGNNCGGMWTRNTYIIVRSLFFVMCFFIICVALWVYYTSVKQRISEENEKVLELKEKKKSEQNDENENDNDDNNEQTGNESETVALKQDNVEQQTSEAMTALQ